MTKSVKIPANDSGNLYDTHGQFVATPVYIVGQSNFGQGGGGGGGSDITGRLKLLEDRVEKLSDQTGQSRIDIATITERVSHLPTKGFIIVCLTTSVSVVGALVLMTDKIKAWF